MRSRATLRDVARAVGVHPSTVSRVMNPKTRHLLTEDVVARVLKVADTLGYRTNAIAAGLRTRRSRAVGIIIPDITNPVFPPILLGIEDMLRSKGYISIIANAGNESAHQLEILNELGARQVDGFILATVTQSDPVLDACLASGIPAVVVNRTDIDRRVASVVTDDVAGSMMAVAHLTSLGHRRVAYIAGPQSLSTGIWRLKGYREALGEAGIPFDPALVAVSETYSRESGRLCAERLLDRKPRPSAVIAANDLLALGCYDALNARGLLCPSDVSVTGFNDMPLVDMVSPPLTTLRIRHHDIGARAAQILVNKIEHQEAGDLNVVLKPELVVRGSTGPASAQLHATADEAASRAPGKPV